MTITESITVGDQPVELLRPRSAEELIRPEDFEIDERLPYWAELWPAARLLADHLSRVTPHGAGRLLELGCGLGLATVAALRSGWSVVATDYEDDALRFCTFNAAHNAGRVPCTRHVDWRNLPDDLGTFDTIVGADVLYERPYPALIASALERALAPSGIAWIADPGRVHAARFAAECQAHNLHVRLQKHTSLTLFLVARSSPSSPDHPAGDPPAPGS